MQKDIDTIISQTIHIAKYVAMAGNQTFEERTATILQFHTLNFLESNPNAKLSDVAKHITASLSATTQLIDRMHKAGFIERKGDENDRRVILLSVTKEGHDKLKHIKEAKRERMKELLSKLTTDEIKQLINIQEKLLDK